MATLKEQREVVKGLRLREGENRRINCPFCGGTKTFSASRRAGELLWNCYRASCNAVGGTGAEMSGATLLQRLEGGRDSAEKKNGRPIPEHLTTLKSNDVALEYLDKVNCREALDAGYVKLRYSPAENRVLFFTPNGEGAVGRALDRRKPKWQAYGDTSGIFSIGRGSHAVVVEDTASAGSVSRIPCFTGCALLGTHLTVLAKSQLKAFDKVTIALDKDASKKALTIKEKLEGRVVVNVALLSEDLKYVPEAEIRRLIL